MLWMIGGKSPSVLWSRKALPERDGHRGWGWKARMLGLRRLLPKEVAGETPPLSPPNSKAIPRTASPQHSVASPQKPKPMPRARTPLQSTASSEVSASEKLLRSAPTIRIPHPSHIPPTGIPHPIDLPPALHPVAVCRDHSMCIGSGGRGACRACERTGAQDAIGCAASELLCVGSGACGIIVPHISSAPEPLFNPHFQLVSPFPFPPPK